MHPSQKLLIFATLVLLMSFAQQQPSAAEPGTPPLYLPLVIGAGTAPISCGP